jgi:hypothetical protein
MVLDILDARTHEARPHYSSPAVLKSVVDQRQQQTSLDMFSCLHSHLK